MKMNGTKRLGKSELVCIGGEIRYSTLFFTILPFFKSMCISVFPRQKFSSGLNRQKRCRQGKETTRLSNKRGRPVRTDYTAYRNNPTHSSQASG